ncbi:MAG: helix-turn-helix domain-containing GNAT family N-acetyltransferase [Bacteroidetes bacterium]|nr:helix-turn-helix domain-containing GNAT family N-acetyltransferase [Bacteroidota bacterium]
MTNILKELRESAVSHRIKRLSENLINDTKRIYKELNIDFEPRWFVISHLLNERKSASINELSNATGYTHPAIIQIVEQMMKNKLIETSKNLNDKRKRKLVLTKKGENIFDSIHPVVNDIEDSIKEINNEAGYDILHVIESFENALNERSLYERTKLRNKKRQLDTIEIIRYSPSNKEYFKQLNFEWLQKYFEIENEDIKILSDPENEIIKKGGEIFLARYEGEIVGTCAAIKLDKENFELAKLCVTEKAQGKQIGKKLALAVIGFTYAKGAKAVLLETARSLKAAIKLYESLGFKYIPDFHQSNYKRPTFWMKLDLK